MNHGVLPDMCILGEPTDMHVVLEHFGSMWVRISCTGIYVHTAFCEGREEMNSIRRMHELMEPIMQWIAIWEKKAAYGGTEGDRESGRNSRRACVESQPHAREDGPVSRCTRSADDPYERCAPRYPRAIPGPRRSSIQILAWSLRRTCPCRALGLMNTTK